MSRHTPGPWTYDSEFASYGYDIRVDVENFEDRVWVATAMSDHDNEPRFPLSGNVEANARLIAAAPELLAACEALLEEHDQTYDGGPIGLEYLAAIEAAQRAVRKATGETK